MNKWNMIIDVAKCHDCNNCFLACKDEFVDNDWPPYSVSQPLHGHRWMDIMRKERGQFPLIDVAGNAAIARVDVFREDVCVYSDYVSLYRVQGEWRLVSKVFHAHLTGQP